MERVVGDESFPREVPQRLDTLGWIPAAGGLMQRAKKGRALRPQVFKNRGFTRIKANEPDNLGGRQDRYEHQNGDKATVSWGTSQQGAYPNTFVNLEYEHGTHQKS